MTKLTKFAMTVSLLTSPLVMAGNDYPASSFEPKVLYSSPEAASTSAAPAAVAAPAKAVEAVENDASHPAANFQPKVIYSDADYKHSSAAPGVPAAAKSSSNSVSSNDVEVASAAEKQPESNTNLFALVGLAAVGFFLFNKKSAKSTSSSAANDVYSSASEGATGVEKYLEKQGMNKTGVAKYLEKQTENPATGVAKYMAKQIIRDREAAAERATGVEKYLRDNG